LRLEALGRVSPAATPRGEARRLAPGGVAPRDLRSLARKQPKRSGSVETLRVPPLRSSSVRRAVGRCVGDRASVAHPITSQRAQGARNRGHTQANPRSEPAAGVRDRFADEDTGCHIDELDRVVRYGSGSGDPEDASLGMLTPVEYELQNASPTAA